MRSIINNFLQLQAQNVESAVLLGLAGIYVLLLLTTVSSVVSRPRGFFFKLAWSLLIVTLPFAGMALYACLCIWQADRSFLSQLGMTGQHRKDRKNKFVTLPESPTTNI
ncbi:MAG: PLDc N-terminal domain-containing protein [Verrucomicrobiaceae bacterium]|nr:PLDc N-terminal domain-containing protein [Verrucomicrobiaceae bacterium]